jgi:uncharacterized protein (TIGR00661 family)
MKILYGVAGEGFGHSSRARVIAKYLEEKGHEVIIMTYGQAYSVLKNKFKVFKVRGLGLIFKKSVLKKRKTFVYNLEHFPKNLRKWKRFHKLMKEFKPDLCISDMEPIVPILRNWYGLPLICIDNQHRLTNLKINVPSEYKKDFIIAREVTNAFVRKADYFIISSYSITPLKDKYKKNSFIVPPIIRNEIKKQKSKSKYGEKILVYLTKKDKSILKILKNINEKFVVYGYNKNKKIGNLEFKTKESFLRDLVNCKAVIATAGFTLLSESIYLKKPYFALPLKRQFEQTLNALFLKKADFGEYSEDVSEKEINYFLKNLGEYKKKLKSYNPDYNKLYKVLDKTVGKLIK